MYKEIFYNTFISGKKIRITGGVMSGYYGVIKSADYLKGIIITTDNFVVDISTSNIYIY